MCSPALLGATGATGAAGAGAGMFASPMAGMLMQGLGTMLQMQAARKAEAQRAEYLRLNRDRNRKLEDEAALSIGESTESFDREKLDPELQEESSDLAGMYQENTAPIPMPVNNMAGVPRVIAEEMTKDFAAANAFNEQQNAALGELNSFGNYLQSTLNPQLAKSAADSGLVGNFMRGNSSVLPAELEAANQMAFSPLAQLLTGAGKTATSYGLYSPTGNSIVKS